MKTFSLAKVATFCWVLLSLTGLNAQDIHFSQFGNSPLNLNPGLTGVYACDMRFAGSYRNQWRSVPVPYSTFAVSAENKFYHKKGRYDRYFAAGLMINHDQQGTLKLTSLQIGIPVSYTAPISKNNFLTFGVTPMFGQRSFKTDKLTFDAQWVDCIYDPSADSHESQLFASTNLKYFDISGGLNFHTQSSSKRTKGDIGFGMFHINRPSHNFWTTTQDVKLASKLTGYGMGTVQLAKKADLVANLLFQKQGTYKEIVVGLAGRFHLNQNPYNHLALQLGLGYRQRYTDALIPSVELHWRTWLLGLSYDINLSDFDKATTSRGGPELSLQYRICRVKPLPIFKTCPLI